jgi:uncharacterized membrane protein YcfT
MDVREAILFVVIVALAATALLLAAPTWRTAACVAALCWASARAYYFAFHVLERYVDPTFRFRGLTSLLAHLARSRRRT